MTSAFEPRLSDWLVNGTDLDTMLRDPHVFGNWLAAVLSRVESGDSRANSELKLGYTRICQWCARRQIRDYPAVLRHENATSIAAIILEGLDFWPLPFRPEMSPQELAECAIGCFMHRTRQVLITASNQFRRLAERFVTPTSRVNRDQEKTAAIEEWAVADSEDDDGNVERSQRRLVALECTLAKLSTPERQLVRLVWELGLPIPEIAPTFGLSAAKIRATLNEIRRQVWDETNRLI